MRYEYRWLYAGLLSTAIIVFGYVSYLQLPFSQLLQAYATHSVLRLKIEQAKKLSMENLPYEKVQMVKSAQQADMIADLATAAHLQGLLIHVMKMNEKILHVDLQGNFAQLAAFVAALKHYSAPILRFSLNIVTSDQLQLTLDVLPLHHSAVVLPFANNKESAMPWHSPFCGAQNWQTMFIQNESLFLQAMPLALLKMVGYLQQGEHKQALIALPNNTTAAVTTGTLLGKEHGVVTRIEPNQIVVTTGTAAYYLKINGTTLRLFVMPEQYRKL